MMESSNLSEVEFFYRLLGETDAAYKRSAVYNRCPNCSYSVCGSPIHRGGGLLLGLNWGGGVTLPQTQYPDDDDFKTYPYINRLFKYLKGRLNTENLNYSNLCFFRSPNVKDLEMEDWNESKSLIRDYINYVQPAWILLTSTELKYARSVLNIDVLEFTAKGKREFKAYKGSCMIFCNAIPFYAVPHPNAKVEGSVRNKLWEDILPKSNGS